MKTCTECKVDKPDNKFRFKKVCKACVSARYRAPKKARGYFALPKETQDKIVECHKKQLPIKSIALLLDLEYGTLYSWIKKGHVPTPE